jgi:hypothetical protein
MCELPLSLTNFIERHDAPDRRHLTLRLAKIRIRISRRNAYLSRMRRFEYCKPVLAKKVPTGPRLDSRDQIRWVPRTRRSRWQGREAVGLDWTWRFPFIIETALKMHQTQFIIDGEICVLDVQGISDFNALHSNRHNEEASFMPSTWSGSMATTCGTSRCTHARPG